MSPDTCAGAVAGGESGDVVPEHPERPVAAFVRTLFSLLNGPYEDTLIAWSDDGERIVVADPSRFAAEVCPKFFRHKNWNSFSRMLNMYEFHKVPAGAHGAQVHASSSRRAPARERAPPHRGDGAARGAGRPAPGAAPRRRRGRAPVEHWFGDLHPDPAAAEDWALAPGGGAGGAELRDVSAASVAEAGAPDALVLRPALGFDPMDLDDVPHHASPGFMAQIHDFVASSTCCASPAKKA
ncbi:DNA binding protein [Aureococcus anophagefferens]|nr:DNA binding protein [Aureococcus anophagefferens]